MDAQKDSQQPEREVKTVVAEEHVGPKTNGESAKSPYEKSACTGRIHFAVYYLLYLSILYF
jgi:hypothetical protein